MKKYILLQLIALLALNVFAQHEYKPTDEFDIIGKLHTDLIVDFFELKKFPEKQLPDLQLYNNKGEQKAKITGLKGVLLKDMLNKIEYYIEKPKEQNEYYFAFISSDDYRVVFSWNEIFNSETGNNLYVITEKEGKRMEEMPERMLIVSVSDIKPGRRYMKAVEHIVVNRIW